MTRQLERPFLHPFLFAVYPILLIYNRNQEQLTPELALVPILLSLLLALVVLVGSHVVFRDKYKDAFFTSIFLVLFYSFNQLLVLFNSVSSFQIFRGRYKSLLFAVVLAAFLFVIWRSKRSFKPLATVLNVAALFLVSFNLVSIVGSSAFDTEPPPLVAERELGASAAAAGQLPDIYYIIVDGYANSRILEEVLGYDNSEFEDFLRSHGFFVVSESYSNYPQTSLSLRASLNMTHLEPSKESVNRLGTGSDNRLIQFLREHDYVIVNPSEEWETARIRYRDGGAASLGDLLRTEFALTLAKVSMLDPIMTRMQWYSVSVRRFVRFVLEALREAPDLDLGGPKYSFIYLLPPHPPYVFGPNGEDVEGVDFGVAFDVFLSSWDNKVGYLNQVEFINKQLMEIIPEILSKHGDHPPVIIIQGDHGPTFTRAGKPDGDYYRMRFGILNAYHLPSGGNELLYDGITPVNSFRLVLNHYFGEELPRLEDRSYFSAFETPYDMVDVTELIRRREP
jgi:hypothetical protein